MRKLCNFRAIVGALSLVLCGVGTVAPGARAAEMVNVEYIHAVVQQKWGITVPYNAALENPKVAANVKYLLAVVDKANEMLNGAPTTDYVHGEYATEYAVDTVATLDAVARLIKDNRPAWSFTTADDTNSFKFKMSAAGDFTIDWGDGARQTLARTDTTETTYSHTYASAGAYTVTIKGQATGYNLIETTPVISFAGSYYTANLTLASISGGLGRVFPTLADGTQPRFYQTFFCCSNLKGEIPSDLFDGVVGAPVSYMFSNTFYGCTGLTGGIPENLFAGIQGAPASYMFNGAFQNCTGLTGGIPENLFAGIQGAPASYMFSGAFQNCSGLTSIPENLFAGINGKPAASMFRNTFQNCSGLTSIPENLFAGIQGAPASYMFSGTFQNCSGLTSIPENLFRGISGTAQSSMFNRTFYNCTNLTGPSAQINGKYLYEIWSGAYGSDCYENATGLDDYAAMPGTWK